MWRVVFHPLVWKEDLVRLDLAAQREIVKAIEKKLPVAPGEYGQPLEGELAGLWRGDYGAVYRIAKERVEVLVLKVGIRRDTQVYRELVTRLGRIKRHG